MTGQLPHAAAEMSPGAAAIIAWSRKIHGPGGDRHEWACAAAIILDAEGADADLPRFPSRFHGVPESRADTVRRIWRAQGRL